MSWGWVFAGAYVVSVGLLLAFMRGACVRPWWEDVQDDIDSLDETSASYHDVYDEWSKLWEDDE